ncbi:MAG: PQQ-dependent sugar dehydrogenase [Phycisphaerae bacterium]|nr:PQQ-dependent sugar dehydrogenase [Phycisphaerae bacterium]
MLCLRFKLLLTLLVFSLFVTAPVLAQDVDLAWTFGNVGSSSYRLDAYDPPGAVFGALGASDPTLPLELGMRYQVRVINYQMHPLEILAKAASAGQDMVLLSMGGNGSFQSDPDVNWQDNGSGTVQFTLTQALYNAMIVGGRNPGYRCRPHMFTMRGDFEVTGFPIASRIHPGDVPVELQEVVSGLAAPVDLKPAPGSDELYVADQAGVIYRIQNGVLQPFLDVRDRLVALGIRGTHDDNDYDERGLLGFSFHPDFTNPRRPGYGHIYTHTSEPVQGPADFPVIMETDPLNHQGVILEWRVTPGGQGVEPDSVREILRVDQPQFNHNGGALAFGQDGYLYIALGDGGAANDQGDGHGPDGNGQNLHTVLGSILRIDPLRPETTPLSRDTVSANGAYRIPWDNPFVGIDGIDEIYAYGFRNPYRFSFDRLSDMLLVADVGQDYVEEINIVRKGGNYGWHVKEGTFLFDPEGLEIGLPWLDPNLIDPVAQYDHDDGLSVIGGFMYYGRSVPELRAQYVFGDFSTGFSAPGGRLFYADLLSGEIRELRFGQDKQPMQLFLKGLGQDSDGEIYVLAGSTLGPFGTQGTVMKLVGAGDSPLVEPGASGR